MTRLRKTTSHENYRAMFSIKKLVKLDEILSLGYRAYSRHNSLATKGFKVPPSGLPHSDGPRQGPR